MSEADDIAGREFERTVRRALDGQQRPMSDGGPPTMPTEAVREPRLRPDPGLPDPLSGGSGEPAPPRPRAPAQPQARPQSPTPDPARRETPRQAPAVDRGQSAPVPRPQAPSERPPSQPQMPQQRPQPTVRADHSVPNPRGLDYGAPQQRVPEQRPTDRRAPGQQAPEYRSPPQQAPEYRSPAQQAPEYRSTAQQAPPYRPPAQQAPQNPQNRAVDQPRRYPADHAGGPQRHPGGPGPGADHRRAVAEQWADPRSARPQANQKPKSKGRRKRDAKEVQGNRAREAKWAANRWSVPYFTDGPKVTFGVLWFAFLMGGALLGFNYDNAAVSSVAVAVVSATIAALAGLQIGFAWFPKNSATRTWTAIAAFVTGIAGFYGPWGVVIGLVIGLLILTTYLVLYRGHRRTSAQLFDVLVRAAVPVGLASASLSAMAYRNLPVLIALVLFVSAYEVGDFLVGSGAFNPVEGPMAGLIAAGVVAFFLFLIQPDPFSSETILMFVAVAAVCCVAGQYLASALLPRGSMWAPALRRLDSYLLIAPLWLLLLVLLPDVH